MIGAIFGDIVGSVHEHASTKTTDFPLFTAASHFTDDTVLTIATADALLTGKRYEVAYRDWARRYPNAGYGGTFRKWLRDRGMGPYDSYGNGSAMRVSPVAFAFDTADEVLAEAERSAEVTHNHPEGIKGAQATALAVFRARSGVSKDDIREEISERFGYDLSRSIEGIRPVHRFDVSCQGSVPEALIAFLDTENLEEAVRAAISLGGDADTQAAIAGAAAAAFDGFVDAEFDAECRRRLPADMLKVLTAFEARFPPCHGDAMTRTDNPVVALWERHHPAAYPRGVIAVPEVIPGRAFFPGGYGLWDSSADRPLPPFPHRGIMILGHDFHSEIGYHASLQRGEESRTQPTWRNLTRVLEDANIPLDRCFFTNYYMGLRKGTATTGPFPGAGDPAFESHCSNFLLDQLRTQKPQLIITLGINTPWLISPLSPQLQDWRTRRGLKHLDSVGALRRNVHFDGIDDLVTTVVALTHPSLRHASVRHRQYSGLVGKDAELLLLKEAVGDVSRF